MSAMRSRRKVVGERLCRGPFGHEFPAVVEETAIRKLPNGFWEVVTRFGPPLQRCLCGKLQYLRVPTSFNGQDPNGGRQGT